MQTNNEHNPEDEARALAACYRLLLKKAAERRARMAQVNQGQESLAGEEGNNRKPPRNFGEWQWLSQQFYTAVNQWDYTTRGGRLRS